MTHTMEDSAPQSTASAGVAERHEPWLPSSILMSPAVRFVRLCARSAMSLSVKDRLRELATQLDPSGWQQVLLHADAEGVASLVFSHAASSGLLGLMPPAVAAGLAERYRQTLVNNRRIETLQHRILTELAKSGVEVIPVKGVTLAARYYRNIALRPSGDIDLLIRRHDLHRASAPLRRLGYRPARGLARTSDFLALELATVAYTHPTMPSVELHWELCHRPVYRKGLATTDVWGRSRVVPVKGVATRCLSQEDELRYLSTHCTVDHPVGRLIWLTDIAELVRQVPAGWDWDRFVRETAVVHLAAPVAVALEHCHTWLDLDVPLSALETLKEVARSWTERRAWQTAHAAQHAPHGDLFSPAGLHAHLLAAEGFADRATLLAGVFLIRRWRVHELYGSTSARWRALPLAYLRHWRRMVTFFVRGHAEQRHPVAEERDR